MCGNVSNSDRLERTFKQGLKSPLGNLGLIGLEQTTRFTGGSDFHKPLKHSLKKITHMCNACQNFSKKQLFSIFVPLKNTLIKKNEKS